MICKLCGVEQPNEQFPRFTGNTRRRKVCRSCSRMGENTSDHKWYLTIPFKVLIMLNRSYTEEQNERRYQRALKAARLCVGQFHAQALKGEHHV